jgi:tRNA A37 threonylcarbamoyladenosine dehydratase
MSIDSRRKDEGLARSFLAPGMPEPTHEAEAGPLSRMAGIPGYRQEAVKDACIALIGAGGLGSWIGTGVVCSGLCNMKTV